MRRRERGNSILAVLIVTLLVVAVTMTLLMASTTLGQQTTANIERTAARNGARSGVSLVAAYLNQRLGTADPPKPPSAEWCTDGSGASFLMLYGHSTSGTPSTDLYTAGAPANLAPLSTLGRAAWLQQARALLATRPTNLNYVARVEIEGDVTSYYYHAWSVAATDDAKSRASMKPVVLVNQAALVPYKRLPFSQGGMTGLQAVTLKGTGVLGTLQGVADKPFISTNKNVSLK